MGGGKGGESISKARGGGEVRFVAGFMVKRGRRWEDGLTAEAYEIVVLKSVYCLDGAANVKFFDTAEEVLDRWVFWVAAEDFFGFELPFF